MVIGRGTGLGAAGMGEDMQSGPAFPRWSASVLVDEGREEITSRLLSLLPYPLICIDTLEVITLYCYQGYYMYGLRTPSEDSATMISDMKDRVRFSFSAISLDSLSY